MTWSDQNASNLRALLATTPLVAKLTELRPDIGGNTLEDKAMSASVVEGFEECIKKISELASQAEKPPMRSPYIQGLEKFEQAAAERQ